jgi:exonuclease V gamma subunit
MGLTIRFGSEVEQLSRHLAGEVSESLRQGDLFEAIRVVVPNRTLAKWLQLFLAEEQNNGVVANLELPIFEEALWELSAALLPKGDQLKPLERDVRQWAIAGCIENGTNPALKPLQDYCKAGEETSGEEASDGARRLWQLSGRLARLFEDYESQRPEMIEAWLKNSFIGSPMALAQRALYLEVAALLPKVAPAACSLSQLAKRLPAADPAKTLVSGTRPIFIFGLSQLSALHCELLGRLADHYDLVLYHSTAGGNLWDEAFPCDQRLQAICECQVTSTDEVGEELDYCSENELLQAWGKTGRETLNLLASLKANKVEWLEEEASDKAADGVLGQLQNSLRHPRRTPRRLEQDRSLQVMAAPSIYREVEAVYESILNDFLKPAQAADTEEPIPEYSYRKDAGRLNEVTILVPDMTRYRPAIASIFDARDEIRYNLSDCNDATDSVYGQAVLALLDLAGSSWTRRQIFELVMNPCFQAGVGIDNEDASRWLSWADKLGIFHSFDDEHRKQQAYADGWQYTWQQALTRLRLGRICDSEADAPAANSDFANFPPYEDMHSFGRSADRFCVTLERLYHSLSELAGASRTGEEWAKQINTLMDDFLGISASFAMESVVRNSLGSALTRLAGKDDAPALDCVFAKAANSDSTIPLALLRQIIHDSLAGIPSITGRSLVDGVTIAALKPGCPIPFGRVYILGLGEGEYPRTADRSTLDLRLLSRRIGDVTRTDADRQGFLETLLGAGRKLTLSYVNRDLQKDEEKFASPLIRELERYAVAHLLTGTTDNQPVFQESQVSQSSAGGLRIPQGNSGNETKNWSDFGTCFRLEPRMLAMLLEAKEQKGEIDQAIQKQIDAYVAKHPRTDLAKRLREIATKDKTVSETSGKSKTASETSAEVVPVKIKDLATFLKDPAASFVQRHLDIYDEYDNDEDEATAENEPLSTGFPADYNLLTKPILGYLRDENRDEAMVNSCFERIYQEALRASQTPEGAFATLDRQKLKTALDDNLACVASAGGQAQSVVIGDSALYDESPDVRLDALQIDGVELPDGRCVSVALSGSHSCAWGAEANESDTEIRVLRVSKEGKPQKAVPSEKLLDSFLFALCTSLSRQTSLVGAGESAVNFQVGAMTGGKKEPLKWYCYQFSRKDSEDYLRRLLEDFLDGSHADVLPYSLIQKLYKPKQKDDLEPPPLPTAEELRAELLQSEINEERYPTYRPNEMTAIFTERLTVPDDAQALIGTRLGPIFNHFSEEG